jgi:hypothetical protein
VVEAAWQYFNCESQGYSQPNRALSDASTVNVEPRI